MGDVDVDSGDEVFVESDSRGWPSNSVCPRTFVANVRLQGVT